MAFTDAIASRPPAAPRQCPIMDCSEISIFQSFLPGNNAVPKAIVEPPVVLTVNIALGLKPPNLAAESGVHVIAEDGYEPHPGDDHALLRVLLPLGGGGGGGNHAQTPGERPDGDSSGEVRRRLPERVERRGAEGGGVERLHCGGGGRRRDFRCERGECCSGSMQD
nr:hypothetical protein Iba_chr13bCG4550 [Ipomoea batatas]